MRRFFFIAFALTVIISCAQRPRIKCLEFSSEFEQYVIDQDDRIYYWKDSIESLLEFFDKHDACIKTLNLKKLKSQFSILITDESVDGFSYSIAIFEQINGSIREKVPFSRFTSRVYFKINSKTKKVEETKIISGEEFYRKGRTSH